jgi:hypothetical protein
MSSDAVRSLTVTHLQACESQDLLATSPAFPAAMLLHNAAAVGQRKPLSPCVLAMRNDCASIIALIVCIQ